MSRENILVTGALAMSVPILVLRYVNPVSILIGEKEIGMERKTKSENDV